MFDLLIVSGHKPLVGYIALLVSEFSGGRKFRLRHGFPEKVDLLIIDPETISLREAKRFTNDCPALLFARKISPFLVSYISQLSINGVMALDMEPRDIKRTVSEALKGEIYFHNEMISLLFSDRVNELSRKVSTLTQREIEIIKLMLADKTNEEMAVELELGLRTVNTHKRNIMEKIGAKTASGLVKIIMDYLPLVC